MRPLPTLLAFLALLAAACSSESPVGLDAERGVQVAEEQCGVPNHKPC